MRGTCKKNGHKHVPTRLFLLAAALPLVIPCSYPRLTALPPRFLRWSKESGGDWWSRESSGASSREEVAPTAGPKRRRVPSRRRWRERRAEQQMRAVRSKSDQETRGRGLAKPGPKKTNMQSVSWSQAKVCTASNFSRPTSAWLRPKNSQPNMNILDPAALAKS